MLRKSIGNMYPWVSHTINFIKGECPHDCSYCYVKRFPVGKLRLDEKEFKTNLGKGNSIFIGSSCDMFAKEIPKEWIWDILVFIHSFDNKYVFQTKNPKRFLEFLDDFPKNTLLGITLESNRNYDITNAPFPWQRYNDFLNIKGYKKFVSVEPILNFDLSVFSYWLINITPEFVSIGADSKGHNLIEPKGKKIQMLIDELKPYMKVKLKDNLNRLLK